MLDIFSAHFTLLDLVILTMFGEKKNSVVFSPQTKYTDRATAACRRS
jgi:hypothetical protein